MRRSQYWIERHKCAPRLSETVNDRGDKEKLVCVMLQQRQEDTTNSQKTRNVKRNEDHVYGNESTVYDQV